MDEVAHKTTRILIADDHTMFIDGIKSLLRKFDKAEIVAEAEQNPAGFAAWLRRERAEIRAIADRAGIKPE